MQEGSGASQAPLAVAAAFAELSAKAAVAANENRRRIAQRNIDAETDQVTAAASQQRRALAQTFARHQGAMAANAAYRGVSGPGSTEAAVASAARVANQEAATIGGNLAAQEAAILARHDFIPEDIGLAMIRGGLEGFSIGQNIQNMLNAQMTTTEQKGKLVQKVQHSQDPRVWTTNITHVQMGDTTTFSTPGFDLPALLGL